MIASLARRLHDEAERAMERRLLVLAGDRDRGFDAAYDVVEAVGVADADVTVISTRTGFRFEERSPRDATDLLGQTRDVVVIDCHKQFVPNTLGQVSGVVDGGGLLVLVTPPLDRWPAIRDAFDDSLAVPPATIEYVSGRFRTRIVETLRQHPGVAIVDLDPEPSVCRDGCTDPPDYRRRYRPSVPSNARFSAAAYKACLTGDQSRALRILERLATPGTAVVVESDRGRGKSSAAGLAAGSLALEGADVLITAPTVENATEIFDRARERLSDHTANSDSSTHTLPSDPPEDSAADRPVLSTPAGGRVRFSPPVEAASLPGEPDAVIVDEAASLPVRLLERFLNAPSVAFCTTIHGYEGAGRGFSVRFRERLAASDLAVRDVQLDEPIRYARNDPVEAWVFRALLLDARPAVDAAVTGTTPADVTYRCLDPDELGADERLLSEAFGLLVVAHYRTEPNDLARMLDAPNLSVRALMADGHVVAVALLAREGGLPVDTRRRMYEGERVRGNMVPDLLTSQLRDEDAATTTGLRTVRIATHPALRGAGLGSLLLDRIHTEFVSDVAYFAVGYGATPRLLRFWRRAGYRTVHLSTTQNATSGEHSAVMLRPVSDAGEMLTVRHATQFRNRERDALSDAHRDVDPDVVRGVLRSCPSGPDPTLSDHEWRVVVSASYGPGMYDVAPGAFRDLAMAALVGDDGPDLSARTERLLVRKVLQGRAWAAVVDELDFVSTRACMRALGEAMKPLVDRYGPPVAIRERDRFTDS